MWTILGGGLQLIYARDFDGALLATDIRSMAPNAWSTPWGWSSDTIWRGSQRLAQVDSSGTTHYHVDHLGTPRLHTNENGVVTERLDIFPFGRDAPGTASASVSFTGHERDNRGTGSGVDDMDYMHARFYSPQMARFFQVDAINGDPKNPQSWNRYAYVQNNPLKYVDPFGLLEITATGEDPCPGAPSGVSCGEWERQRAEEHALRMMLELQLMGFRNAGQGPGDTRHAQSFLAQFPNPQSVITAAQQGNELAMVAVGTFEGAEGGRLESLLLMAAIPGPFDEIGAGALTAGRISGFTRHGLHRAISREGVGVAPRAMLNAVRSPTRVVRQANGTVKFVGGDAVVVLNSRGRVMTTWATSNAGRRVP